MEYRLYAVRVFVTDWERAVRFYTETLGIPVSFRSDEDGWVQLATGEGQLALERAERVAEHLAEVGVVVLLFTVGMELAVGHVGRMRRAILIGGGYATAWPCDEPRPETANVNFAGPAAVSNFVAVAPDDEDDCPSRAEDRDRYEDLEVMAVLRDEWEGEG